MRFDFTLLDTERLLIGSHLQKLFQRIDSIGMPHRHEALELSTNRLCRGNRNVKVAFPDTSKRISMGKTLLRNPPHTYPGRSPGSSDTDRCQSARACS